MPRREKPPKPPKPPKLSEFRVVALPPGGDVKSHEAVLNDLVNGDQSKYTLVSVDCGIAYFQLRDKRD